MCDIDQAVDFIEMSIDWLRLSLLRKELRLNVLQQDGIELGDGLRRPVIMLHQIFTGAPCIRRLEAEGLRNRRLHIEYQPVLASPGMNMQPDPDILERALLLRQLTRLGRGDQSSFRELAPGAAKPGHLGDP